MNDDATLPEAEVAPARRGAPLLLPLLAIAVAIFLGVQAWLGRGPELALLAREGHGLSVGDALRFRGVAVGEVRDVALADELGAVRVVVALQPEAEGLCREGSEFWIVRPHLALDSVEGLETLVGARYLSCRPGPIGGPARYEFRALEAPPVAVEVEPEGLELWLDAPARWGLGPGAEISYRGVVVGRILEVDLAGDGSAVEVSCYIEPRYVGLVRENSVFWSTGGLEVGVAWTEGLRLELESLKALLLGGVALATPTSAGAPVVDGARFSLLQQAPEEASTWRPALLVGEARPSPDATPELELASVELTWVEGRVFKTEASRRGWAIPVEGGYVLPASLASAPAAAREGSAALVLDGITVPPVELEDGLQPGLVRIEREHALAARGGARARAPEGPEDALVRHSDVLLALDRERLGASPRGWRVDPALPVPPDLTGLPVLARADSRWIGVLEVTEEGAWVLPLSGQGLR